MISVIVPVYNVEKYLDRCVESIVQQTYKNLEIILVDDGSTDKSGEICDHWATKDERVKVLHQPNMGGGAARNAALDIAKGDFIAFVDSDDYIAPDMYEHLMTLIEQGADISECNYTYVDSDSTDFKTEAGNIIFCSTLEALENNITDKIFRRIIWNKLYKRELIGNIRFPIGTKIDDEFFTYRILGNAKVLVHSEKICYAYRQHNSSVMHTANVGKCIQSIESRLQRYEYIKTYFPQLQKLCLKNVWVTCIYQYQVALKYYKNDDTKALSHIVEKIIRENPLSLNGLSFKERIWFSMAKISLPFTCGLRNILGIGL